MTNKVKLVYPNKVIKENYLLNFFSNCSVIDDLR